MARPKKIAFEISARDKQATASLRRLSAKFTSLMKPLDRLNRKLRANQRALKPITQRLNRLSNNMQSFGKKASLGLTLPILAAGAATVKTSASFETGMIKVRALTRATQSEFQKLEGLAKRLGSTTQFSAREAADGMSYLGMAGFKTGQIVDAIPGVLDLAAASQLELGETADFASNILTGFGKNAADMGKISDQLTYGFTNANTTLTQLHDGLAKVGGIATKAGLSFEDMTANMMALADAGHKAENAGVALAGGVSRIIKFSMDGKANEVTKTLAQLGINRSEFLFDKGAKRGQMKISFSEFIEFLDSKKASIDQYMRIFGQDAGKYLVGLSGKFEKLTGYIDGLKNKSEGLTSSIAKEYMSGTEGSFKLLLSALEGLMIALGDTGFLDVVNASIRSLANFIQDISGASKPFLKFTVIAAGVLAVLGPLPFTLGLIAQGFVVILPFLTGVGAGFALLGIKILAISAIVGVAVYALFLLVKNWSVITGWMAKEWEKFTDGVKYLAENAGWALKKSFVEATNDVIDNLNRLLNWIKNTSFGSWLSEKFGFEIDGNLTQMAIPEKPYQPIKNQAEVVMTDNYLDTLLPRLTPLKPLVWSGSEPAEKEWNWLPDAISKGFAGVFDKSEGPTIKVLKDDSEANQEQGFDFYSFKKQIFETKITEKQQLDINVNLSGGDKDTRVETKNRSRSRVSIDTGKVMVGA